MPSSSKRQKTGEEQCRVLLKRVQLVDFMCHKNLVVDFNAHVTCITGENGSGKSAIMIAIGILFGVRAYAMERGSRMQELIRAGAERAQIFATLHNTDYEKDLAGSEITIEKTLDREGPSKLRVLGAGRNVVGTSAESLSLIMEHLRINFANPLCFLTQDTSKKFLGGSTPQKLYRFFKMGTDLEEMSAFHAQSSENLDAMTKQLQDATRQRNESAAEAARTEKVLALAAAGERLEARLAVVKREHAWGTVRAAAKRVADGEEGLADLEAQRSNKLLEKEALQKRAEDAAAQIESLEHEQRGEASRHRQREFELDSAMGESKRRTREIERELADKKRERDIRTDSLKTLSLIAGATERPQETRRSYEEKLQSCVEKLRELEARKADAFARQEGYSERKERFVEKKANLEKTLRDIEAKLRMREGAQKERIQLFGRSMANVVRSMEGEQFEGRVLGPIGMEVAVKSAKWTRAVEAALSKVLCGFIVTCRADRERLLSIFRKNSASYPIYLPSDTSDRLVPYRRTASFLTMLDVVKTSSPVVTNQLIALCGVERILLVEDRAQAHSIIRGRPEHVDCAYTLEADRIMLRSGAMMDTHTRPPEKSIFDDGKEGILQLETYRAKLREELGNLKFEEVDCSTEMYEITRERPRLEAVKRELQCRLSSREGEGEGGMAREIDRYECEIREFEMQMASLAITLGDARKEEERLSLERSSLEAPQADSMAGNKVGMLKKAKAADAKLCGQLDIDLRRIEEEAGACRADLARTRDEWAQLRRGAPEECAGESMEPRATQRELEREMVEIEARIECIQGEEIDPAALEERLRRLAQRRKKLELIMGNHQSKVEAMRTGLSTRVQRRESLRAAMAERAEAEFRRHTSARGYGGTLQFDHELETLDMQMAVEGGSGDKQTLSGGERSFAGVCFLLSLWPSLSAPLRILDEFDVYMDGVNRKAALGLVVNAAFESASQVILITPLGTGDVPKGRCEIIRLLPPEA